jgi:hypothetical protein
LLFDSTVEPPVLEVAMLDPITPIFGGMAGSIVLLLLPIAIALGVGLLIVGVIRGRLGLGIGGIAFPVAVAVVGFAMRSSALSNPQAPPNIAVSMEPVLSLMPYAVLAAVGVFLFAVLPGLFRVWKSR